MIRTTKLYTDYWNQIAYKNRRGCFALCSSWAHHIYNFHRATALELPVEIEVRVTKRWHPGSVLFQRKGYSMVVNVMRSAHNTASHAGFKAGYWTSTTGAAQRFLDRIRVHTGDRFWVSIRPAKKVKARASRKKG